MPLRSAMEIYLLINSKQTGPYSKEEVLSRLRSNQISGSTLAWTESSGDWIPVIDLITKVAPPSTQKPLVKTTRINTIPPKDVTRERSTRKLKKDLAISALVFGIIGAWIFPFAIPAVICGHLALPKIAKAPQRYGGRGMALWGVWLGWIGIFFGIVTFCVKMWMHSTINEGLEILAQRESENRSSAISTTPNERPTAESVGPTPADWLKVRGQIAAFYEATLHQVGAGSISADEARRRESVLLEKLGAEFGISSADLKAESEKIGKEVFLSQEPPAKPLPETGHRFLSPIAPLPSYTIDGQRLPDNRAPLKISVPNQGEHYYIKVVDRSNRSRTEYLFIRSGDSFEIRVPLGSYEIVYAVGKTWRGELGPNGYFGHETEFFRCEDTFTFRRDGDQLVGYEIELMRQLNGNLETEKIDPGEF